MAPCSACSTPAGDRGAHGTFDDRAIGSSKELWLLVSDGTATALEQTNPRKWPLDAWISDIIPRCAYGWVACIAYDRITAND